MALAFVQFDAHGPVHSTLAEAEVAPEVNTAGQQRVETVRLDTAVNLAMLIPMGALLPIAFSTWRSRSALLALLATSAIIELLQLTVFTHRYAQWSDVVLNVLGGALGYGAVRLVQRRRQ